MFFRIVLISVIICLLAKAFINYTAQGPRIEPTRPPISSSELRVGLTIELTGTTNFYGDHNLFEENKELTEAGSIIVTYRLSDPRLLQPGDEVRIIGPNKVVVEKGYYRGQVGFIIPRELR